MRRQLIEALTYPRLLVLKIIEDRDCPHDSLFEALNERCFKCELNKECHWVRCLDDFADFEDKPDYTINASLRYGIRLVETLHNELHHDDEQHIIPERLARIAACKIGKVRQIVADRCEHGLYFRLCEPYPDQ